MTERTSMTPLVRVMTRSAGSLSTLKLLTVVEAMDPKCVVTRFSNLWRHWVSLVINPLTADFLQTRRHQTTLEQRVVATICFRKL